MKKEGEAYKDSKKKKRPTENKWIASRPNKCRQRNR